jgi:uncharacterized protein (UPF0218 family)
MLRLPEEKRHLFKAPFGTLYPEISDLLPLLRGHVVYSVGDVVTSRLLQYGIVPSVAVIDGHTMRVPCVNEPLAYPRVVRVKNPPGTISDALIRELAAAVKHPPALIFVEGEEDLAVIPLVILVQEGDLILYGQPGEGVVLRLVDTQAKKKAQELLDLFVRD